MVTATNPERLRIILQVPTIVMLLMHAQIGTGYLVVLPNSTSAVIADSINFTCYNSRRGDVRWIHHPIGTTEGIYVYWNRFRDGYLDGRFNVTCRSNVTYDCDLIIKNVTRGDAGRYQCEEDVRSNLAELTIIDPNLTCESNVKSNGIFGENSCNLGAENVTFSCSVSYQGNEAPLLDKEAPLLEWTSPNNTALKAKPLKIRVNRVTYDVTVSSDLIKNGSVYSCHINTRQSRNISQHSCELNDFRIINAVNATNTAENQINDEVTCLTDIKHCNYTWLRVDNGSLVSNSPTIQLNGTGMYRCEADCDIRGRRCTFIPKLVNVTEMNNGYEENADSGGFNLYFLFILILIPIMVVVFVIWFVICYRPRQKEKKRQKEMKKQEKQTLTLDEYSPEIGDRELNILRVNHGSLIYLLVTRDLCEQLYSKKVINRGQKEFISAKPTNSQKNKALLDMMGRFSLKQYRTTIDCLHNTNQSHFAEILSKGGVVVPVHINFPGDDVDEAEEAIVHEIMQAIGDRSLEQMDCLCELESLRVIAARRGQSVVLYFHCLAKEDLIRLCNMFFNGQLRRIVQETFRYILPQKKKDKTLSGRLTRFFTRKSYLEENLLQNVDLKFSFEMLDMILLKVLLLSMLNLNESIHERRNDADIICSFASVDECWSKRILRLRFKKRIKRHLSTYPEATESNWEEIIRTNYADLQRNIKTEDKFEGILRKSGLFTKPALRSIFDIGVRTERVDTILMKLEKQDFKGFKLFRKALIDDGQRAVVRKYLSKVKELPTPENFSLDNKLNIDDRDCRALSETRNRYLVDNWNTLRSRIDSGEKFQACLNSRDVFTDFQRDRLKDEKVMCSRNEKMLRHLQNGSEKLYDDFCEALKDTNQTDVQSYLIPKSQDNVKIAVEVKIEVQAEKESTSSSSDRLKEKSLNI